jgi:glycogen debranching enzyme
MSDSVTLVAGASVVVSSPTGDLEPEGAHGLFFGGTRFASTVRLRIDGQPLQRLAVHAESASAASFVSRPAPPPGLVDSPLLITWRREVGGGMRDDLVIENLGPAHRSATVTLDVGADFAPLSAVKDGLPRHRTGHDTVVGPTSLTFFAAGGIDAELNVHLTDATVAATGATWSIELAPRSRWATHVEFELRFDGRAVAVRPDRRADDHGPLEDPNVRPSGVGAADDWRDALVRIVADDAALATTLRQCGADLRALRIFTGAHSPDAIFAAGAPWYTTLFGRDALLTSLMTLTLSPTSAVTTLRILARFQGTRVDATTGEEPGKILHHLRGSLASLADARPDAAQFGSIDATPLFVVLLGALARLGLADDVVEELLTHADRALGWIDEFGDLDGDGFVEYAPGGPAALAHHGWKDSVDGTTFADGTRAQAPIALCEVQGYVFAAYRARAELARARGDAATMAHYAARAADLKAAFNERFWLPAPEYYAMGLDREKRPIDAVTSNVGHCLWTGIIDDAHAPAVAARLGGRELFSGWGVRTLASSMAAYNPVSYHNGSVWPHDSAICAAGLARYGFVDEAHRITRGLLDAAAAHGGRLPELFCGFDREDFPSPVAYPSACLPQAWAAATPFFLLLASVFRLDPSLPDGELRYSLDLPPAIGALRIEDIPIGPGRLTLDPVRGEALPSGLPPSLRLLRHRPPTDT